MVKFPFKPAFAPAALALALSLAASAGHAADAGHAAEVDPRIGTGGDGHTFPGATVPFGMIQLDRKSVV